MKSQAPGHTWQKGSIDLRRKGNDLAPVHEPLSLIRPVKSEINAIKVNGFIVVGNTFQNTTVLTVDVP